MASNQGAKDETRIDSIDVFGVPVQCVKHDVILNNLTYLIIS